MWATITFNELIPIALFDLFEFNVSLENKNKNFREY